MSAVDSVRLRTDVTHAMRLERAEEAMQLAVEIEKLFAERSATWMDLATKSGTAAGKAIIIQVHLKQLIESLREGTP